MLRRQLTSSLMREALRSKKITMIPIRRFGLLDPVKQIENSPEFSDILKDRMSFDFMEDEIAEAVRKQTRPIHIYSVYNLNILIKWLFQIELWIMYFISGLCMIAMYKWYNLPKENTKKRRRRRGNTLNDFIPTISGCCFVFTGLMYYWCRRRRLSTLRQLYFCPTEQKYVVEVYGEKLGKILQQSFSVDQMKFERTEETKPYFITFHMPEEKKQRVVKTNGIWLASKLIPLINKIYAQPAEKSESFN